VYAFLIAQRCTDKRFVHGLRLGIANSVWITAAHIIFFDTYVANHAKEAAMMQSMPLPDSLRLMMALTAPVVGVISGTIIGLSAFAAGKLLKPRPRTSGATA
jgi:hypothetical protein